MSRFSHVTTPQTTGEFLTRIYTLSPRNVFSVAVTGGGSGVLAELFSVPGASNSLMSASVPYSHAALAELMGGDRVEKSSSRETAIKMAREVFKNTAKQLLVESGGQLDVLAESNVFGVSCTAALVSSKPRKGLHRCHVALFSNQNRLITWDVCFQKGLRSRKEEDNACSRLVLDAIAAGCDTPPLSDDYLFPGKDEYVDENNPDVEVEVVNTQESSTLENAFQNLFNSKTGMLVFVRKPSVESQQNNNLSSEESVLEQFTILEDISLPEDKSCFVYPGSFNPLHSGHISLAAAAIQHTSNAKSAENCAPLFFEISALNADKPPLSKDEILDRISQFAKGSSMDNTLCEAGISNIAVCVTSKPLFSQKANLFRGCQFVMGADTLSRLFLPKYYDNSRDNMLASLANITEGNHCSFVIGGRKDSSEDGGFHDLNSILAKVELPDCVRRNLFGLTVEQFRSDISSTEIRKGGQSQR